MSECMLSLHIGCMKFVFPKLFVTIFGHGFRIKALGKGSSWSKVRPEDEGISGNQDPLWAFQKAKKIFKQAKHFSTIKKI
jgi:hypothetical protein